MPFKVFVLFQSWAASDNDDNDDDDDDDDYYYCFSTAQKIIIDTLQNKKITDLYNNIIIHTTTVKTDSYMN